MIEIDADHLYNLVCERFFLFGRGEETDAFEWWLIRRDRPWLKSLVTIRILSDRRDYELMMRCQHFRREGFTGELSADALELEGPLRRWPCRFYFGGDISHER